MVSSTSCESLSKALFPSCLTASILSLMDLFPIIAGLFSLSKSMTLGCLMKATTLSL
jgi:hypothetical protein